MTRDKLEKVLDKHKKWMNSECGGERANLSETNLYRANLNRADLYKANLCGANLREADLRETNLYEANLRETNLYEANLCGVNLRGADLYKANLSGANLYRAKLSGANNVPFIPYICPEFGSFIGFKKASNKIVELEILSDAKRCSATTRKCRCNKAKVLSIQELDGTISTEDEVCSNYDENFKYKVGQIVEVLDFDEDRWNEGSTGIHFFICRQEAVEC